MMKNTINSLKISKRKILTARKKKIKLEKKNDKEKGENKLIKNNKNKKISKSVDKKNEGIPHKFTYKDENENIKFYSFHRKSGTNCDLRCMNRNCQGKA